MKSFSVKPLIGMVLTSAIAGLILAILAPFGTHNLVLLKRLTFWIGLCLAGGVGAGAAEYLINRSNLKTNIWSTAFVQSIGATLFVATVFLMFNRTTSLTNVVMVIFYIWVVSIVISGVGALARRNHESVITSSRPAIYDRLKPRLRKAEIYALESEDHYVRVYTSDGEDLILMRLADAIKEMATLRGIKTHRSWWISETGIERINKSDGKISIRLKSGQDAPVSRNSTKSVRDAGWV